MKPAAWILPIFTTLAGFAGEPPAAWFQRLAPPPPVFEASLLAAGAPPSQTPGRRLRLAGATQVEVWGEAPWERQEALRTFTLRLTPHLRAAFQAGLASGTSAQQLAELMAMGADFRPPSIPSVWYNGFMPTPERDPLRIMEMTRGRSRIQVSAGAANRPR